ncbi:MAG: ATP-binding cassette domain-containing protein [Phycisphaerales bacterium]|nr:ATP-binding cassette domain-containing protein [Phycisphaerales bacterium]
MLTCDALTIHAGRFHVTNCSLQVERGQWQTIMGPTGCGKTTVLEGICGLRYISSGSLTINGADVTHAPPGQRGISLVPQDGALFAGMRVEQMMGIPLRARGVRRKDRSTAVRDMAAQLGIASLLRRSAAGLSGGERQRIALGRALLCKPSVLCLDEPLSALDMETKAAMRTVLQRIRDKGDLSVLHVTHDMAEAKVLAHTIRIMEDGQLSIPFEATCP